MTDAGPGDELIDRVVERIMRGQDPDIEALISGAPELSPAARETLRRIAGSFGSPASGATTRSARGDELPYAELGPYKLISRMGEGGMGMVFLAEHRFLERRVALKVIRPELALSPVSRQRFHREATRIAKLRHEHIVSVYDAGEHEGVAYLAMELVEGAGLDEIVQAARRAGERVDPVAAARHARDIARALQCAHEAGIVHRDVKPANVRVTPDGRALLLDFGLSLAEEAVALSSFGQFRGTPQYASPEQVEAGSAEVDGRADVYSLGITLYECLTGEVPFAGGTLLQIFRAILTTDPIEPRARNERVDAGLNGIVMRAIAKRREDRFATAGEMAEALDAWLRASAEPAPPARRAGAMFGVGSVAALVLVVGAGAWLVLRDRDDPAAARTPDDARPLPRARTALLGAETAAFGERLERWGPLVGDGTFGADEDGPGVVGTCVGGLAAEPYALPAGAGSVRGRLEPIATQPGARTLCAGAGLEFSDGRAIGLVLVAAAEGYDVRVCELVRDGDARWTRGTELDARGLPARDGEPLPFRLGWTDTDTRLEWGDPGTPVDNGAFVVPSGWRGSARPSRFLLLVEQGSARFEALELEES